MKYLLSEEEIKALVSRIELHMAEVTDPTPPDEQDAEALKAMAKIMEEKSCG